MFPYTVVDKFIKTLLIMKNANFFRVIRKVKLVKIKKGYCLCELKVDSEHLNDIGQVHTGLLATLLDTYTYVAFLANKFTIKPLGVTTNLHISYFGKTKLGDKILIEAKVNDFKKNLVHVEAKMHNKATKELILEGKQILYILDENVAFKNK